MEYVRGVFPWNMVCNMQVKQIIGKQIPPPQTIANFFRHRKRNPRKDIVSSTRCAQNTNKFRRPIFVVGKCVQTFSLNSGNATRMLKWLCWTGTRPPPALGSRASMAVSQGRTAAMRRAQVFNVRFQYVSAAAVCHESTLAGNAIECDDVIGECLPSVFAVFALCFEWSFCWCFLAPSMDGNNSSAQQGRVPLWNWHKLVFMPCYPYAGPNVRCWRNGRSPSMDVFCKLPGIHRMWSTAMRVKCSKIRCHVPGPEHAWQFGVVVGDAGDVHFYLGGKCRQIMRLQPHRLLLNFLGSRIW